MDVTDLASVEAVAREDDEPVDLLLNTAGIIGHGSTTRRARSTTPSGRGCSTSTPWARCGCSTPSPTASPRPGGAKAITLTSGLGSIGDVGSGSS